MKIADMPWWKHAWLSPYLGTHTYWIFWSFEFDHSKKDFLSMLSPTLNHFFFHLREDVSPRVVGFFTLLLFFKVSHCSPINWFSCYLWDTFFFCILRFILNFSFSLKSFHWLLRLRVEHVEQIGILSRLTHTRLVGLHIFLLLIDLGLVNVCFSLVINQVWWNIAEQVFCFTVPTLPLFYLLVCCSPPC